MRSCIGLLLVLCACGAPPRGPALDAELDAADSAARDAFEAGRLADAVLLYRRALERARAMDDAREIGNAAYNLAVCLVAADKLDAASTALAEARLEFTRAGHGQGLDDARMVAMRLAYRRGDTKRALELARNVEGGEGHLVRGEIACDRKRLDEARAAAEAARATPLSPLGAAHLAHLDGRIARLENRPADAARAFDEQTARLKEAKRFNAVSAALARAGEAYSAAKLPAEAADRYFRAGRSALARGDRESAAAWAEQAHAAAETANDPRLLALCADLKERAQ